MLTTRIRLLDETLLTDASTTSAVKSAGTRRHGKALARIRSTANVPGTLDVVLQHNDSADATTGWKPLVIFDQQTDETGDDGVEDVHISYLTTQLFPHFRAVATIASSGDYTFTVDLWLDR